MAGVLVVVDASTTVKWVLEDEEAREGALALLDDYAAGVVALEAPALLRYEATQALRRAERRARIEEAHVDRALGYLDEVRIALHAAAPPAAMALARRYGISTYDASYIALAERLGAALWTGDQRLVRATAAPALVRWIGEYEPAAAAPPHLSPPADPLP